MKQLTKIILVAVLMIISAGYSQAEKLTNQDTVVVKFGNGSQIVIYIEDKKDLETITAYDINKMLADLQISVENSGGETQVLTIEDETGKKYLKDTTIMIESAAVYDNTDPDVYEYSGSDPVRIDERLDRMDERIDRDYRESRDDRPSHNDRSDRRSRTRQSWNIDLGFNNYLENDKFPTGDSPYLLNHLNSYYLGFNLTYHTQILGPIHLEYGAGVDNYNFSFDNPNIRIDKDPAQVTFQTADPNHSGTKSKFSATYLTAKVLPMIDFSRKGRSNGRLWNNTGNGLRVGLGGYVGYRIHSSSKFKYTELDTGKDRKAKSDRNPYIEGLRYGARAQIGIKNVDVFAMYDLTELFSSNKIAPRLNAFTFGFIL